MEGQSREEYGAKKREGRGVKIRREGRSRERVSGKFALRKYLIASEMNLESRPTLPLPFAPANVCLCQSVRNDQRQSLSGVSACATVH